VPLLSIVIPAYNEAQFIGTLLQRIIAVPTEPLGFKKELIVIDDGSQDTTAEIARGFSGVRVFSQFPNQGKGKAVQRGIRESSGSYILIQDADLEYDPMDYLILLRALGPHTDAVYGSRILGQIREARRSRMWRSRMYPGRHPQQDFGPWLAGKLLTLWTFLLYGKWITDTLTATGSIPQPPCEVCACEQADSKPIMRLRLS
jgi:dolichol-phosphate mannosyltransferase